MQTYLQKITQYGAVCIYFQRKYDRLVIVNWKNVVGQKLYSFVYEKHFYKEILNPKPVFLK